jgi:predicted dienelactone hydrolase
VTTVELPDPSQPGRVLPTSVWYPADPASFEAAKPAEHPLGLAHAARSDPAPITGECRPLIAFSHGNSGFSHQSTFLTTHLASHGFVVAAPDHAGNTFFETMKISSEDERIAAHRTSRSNRPGDIALVIETIVAGAGRWPAVRPDQIGALGHSFGGWTTLKMPRRDPRVRALCGLAPASEPFVGKKAFEPDELPFAAPIPTLLVAALDDVLVDVETGATPLFERLREPRALVGVNRADHFHFCDGIELLHGMHEKNRRPKQTRNSRPYAELLPEARMHTLVNGLVAAFFRATLCGDGLPDLSPEALFALDPELSRLGSA